jgi:cyclopropane fatty-acyl-phospholipid synthase-like methyltransferase
MRSMATVTLFFFGVALAWAQAVHDHHHRFDDAEKWAHIFDDPKRDEWQKPHEVIRALALAPDAAVADVGAGTGYFAVRLARMVPAGRIYAADVERSMVRHLAQRAKREKLGNIVAVQSAPDDASLPDKVDLALLVDVYHHIDDRGRYFARLKNALKDGGRVAIIDFTLDSRYGPPPRARIAPDRVKAELAAAGYALVEQHDFLPEQYFLVFKPR